LSVLYSVRCRFTDPSREAEWNAWYRGHLDVLLSVPGFRSAQRFHSAHAPDDRPYLALYEVASPEVFTSEAYLAIWGFDAWRPMIDNWTRDLSETMAGDGFDFATPTDRTLRAAFVTGDETQVREAFAGLDRAKRALVRGLDRSCSGIAWRVVAADSEEIAPLALPGLQVTESQYEPITEWLTPQPDQEGEV
jgi:hypothetical protein